MVSYATDGGGVGPQFDNYDVFLLQRKRTATLSDLYQRFDTENENIAQHC